MEGKPYDAFISYRHVKSDETMEEWFCQNLEDYRDEGGRTKHYSIFVDKSGLSAGALTRNIISSMREVRNIILICTPDAIESGWVLRELRIFILVNTLDAYEFDGVARAAERDIDAELLSKAKYTGVTDRILPLVSGLSKERLEEAFPEIGKLDLQWFNITDFKGRRMEALHWIARSLGDPAQPGRSLKEKAASTAIPSASASMQAAPKAQKPRRRHHFGLVLFLLIIAAGGWYLYSNPGLIDGLIPSGGSIAETASEAEGDTGYIHVEETPEPEPEPEPEPSEPVEEPRSVRRSQQSMVQSYFDMPSITGF